jgi:plastocyanin
MKFWIFCLSALLLTQSDGVFARTLVLNVVDQQGEPVENVVVKLTKVKLTAKPNTIGVIDQVNKAFLPDQLVINARQAVKFPNSDNVRHHVYSFSSIMPFETRLYKGSETDPIIFEQAGIAVLGCNIHDSMVGYIYVADNNVTGTSNSAGIVEITLPEGFEKKTIQARLWHRHLSIDSEKTYQFELSAEQSQKTIELELITPPKRDTFEDVF